MAWVVAVGFVAVVVLASIAMTRVQFRTFTPLVLRCQKCGSEFHQPPYRSFPRSCPRCDAEDWAAPLGVGDDRGTAEVGKRADLLVLDGDPLASIANTRRIAGVLASGRWLPRRELDARLAALARRYASR